jgi:SNF2 family DNA or RNA helicase
VLFRPIKDTKKVALVPNFAPPAPTYTQRNRPGAGPESDFQLIGSSFLIQNKVAILGDDMGLGKCKQTLDAVMYTAKANFPEVLEVLILCEATNIDTWMNELSKWYPDQAAFAYRGPKRAEKFAKWLGTVQNNVPIFVIMSYSIYRSDYKTVVESWHIDWAILDEGQVIRGCPLNNNQSELGQVIHYLQPARKTFVSGTPLVNIALADYYNIGKWLGLEHREWETYAKDCLTIIQIQLNRYTFVDKIVDQDPGEVQKARIALQSIMLRRTKDDVMPDLPKMSKRVIKVPMRPGEVKAYESMKARHKRAVEQLANGDEPGINPMVAVQKMLYLTSAIDSKIDTAYNLAANAISEGKKVLIFTTHLDTLRMLYRKCHHLGLVFINGSVSTDATAGQQSPRGKAVEAFQTNPSVNVLIGTAQACRTGITLTAAELVILIDEEFSPKYVQQLLDRARRIGQEKPTEAIRLEAVIPNGNKVKVTIERQYHRMLEKKGVSQNAIVDIASFKPKEFAVALEDEDEDASAA